MVFEVQFANENLKFISGKNLGYTPLNIENSIIFIRGFRIVYVQEINILLSVSSILSVLYTRSLASLHEMQFSA